MTADALRAGIERVHREAGGALVVAMIRPAKGLPLLADGLRGDPHATKLLRLVAQAGTRINAAPRHAPAICLCCPPLLPRHELATFAIVLPAADAATTAIGCAICERCAAAADVEEKILGGLREIWPHLRAITITDSIGGHA